MPISFDLESRKIFTLIEIFKDSRKLPINAQASCSCIYQSPTLVFLSVMILITNWQLPPTFLLSTSETDTSLRHLLFVKGNTTEAFLVWGSKPLQHCPEGRSEITQRKLPCITLDEDNFCYSGKQDKESWEAVGQHTPSNTPRSHYFHILKCRAMHLLR